jgi:hypothetical protein
MKRDSASPIEKLWLILVGINFTGIVTFQ